MDRLSGKGGFVDVEKDKRDGRQLSDADPGVSREGSGGGSISLVSPGFALLQSVSSRSREKPTLFRRFPRILELFAVVVPVGRVTQA